MGESGRVGAGGGYRLTEGKKLTLGSRRLVRQALWSFMQDHLERRLNAAPVFTFSGDVDAMQPDEGALVIAVGAAARSGGFVG